MDATKLTLGSGEVYFNRFISGTRTGEGERYIGNTTDFVVDRKLGHAESRKSVRGVTLKNFKGATSEDVTISFTTDNISDDNTADWLGANITTLTAPRLGAQSETFVVVPGRFYQLGLDLYPGIGASNIFGMSVKVGSTFMTDWYKDEVSGRIGVPAGRTDLIGQTMTVEYEIRNSKSTMIKTEVKDIRGSLRFIARNRVGDNQNYFFPEVLLTPRDQLSLKGDNWRTLGFEAESLAPYTVYAITSVGRSPGEQALIEDGVSPTGFVVIEGVLSDALIGR